MSEGPRAGQSLHDAAERRWQTWDRAEAAYWLATRCARLAARMQPLRERLDRVGNLWAAAEQGRLRDEAREARQEYTRLRQRLLAVQRVYGVLWTELRRVQHDWTADDWERYRSLVVERIAQERIAGAAEGQVVQAQSPIKQHVLAASAQEPRSLGEELRRAVGDLLRTLAGWLAARLPHRT
jgi:hypothetical protein